MLKLDVLWRIAVRARGAFLIPCLAWLLCPAASAGTYYVSLAGSDAAAGTNWATAWQTLNHAVPALTNNSTVYISNGTHSITGVLAVPNKGLMQFIGVAGAEQTIIDGQGTSPGFSGYRYILDGLTISNCNSTSEGAGCRITPNSPGNVVQNCVFANCTSTLSGGGMAIYDQTGGAGNIPAVISNCTFIGNQAGSAGGGLDLNLPRSQVIDCRFIGNRANGGSSLAGGGGLWAGGNSHSNLVAGCVFSNNSTASRGGGIRSSSAAPGWIVTNCMVVSNAAFMGGGIYVNNGIVAGCTVVTNLANINGSGGGVYTTATNSQIANCRLVANYAMRDGGGIYNNGSVIGCLVAGNSAGNYGGGVCQTNSAALLRSSTMVANSVVTNGGGVYLGGGGVENSIVYFNSATVAGSNWNYVAGYFTNTCTAPSAAAYGAGNIADDPLFVDFAADNHRLQSHSPCINAGLNQEWMADAVDLDGFPRVRQRIVDMGAYECLRAGTFITVR